MSRRPYTITGILRKILTEQPDMMNAAEQQVRNAFVRELAEQGFSTTEIPNDIWRTCYKVKSEIRGANGSQRKTRREDGDANTQGLRGTPVIPPGNHLPFARGNLDYIFETIRRNSFRLKRRENSWLDFKANYDSRSLADYAKTIAAFANNSGGYIVFGVTDFPHTLQGLGDERFQRLDSRTVGQYLSARYQPTLRWDSCITTVAGMDFGVVYVFESPHKPVVAVRDEGDVKNGDVYYRYEGESKRIRGEDMLRIVSERTHAQNLYWHRLLERMARLAPQDADILDLTTGRIGDTPILIDSDALSQIKFIKEGEFNERDGHPTLKLIGKVEDATGVAVTAKGTRVVGIDRGRILLALYSQRCAEPREFIRQLAYQNTWNLPLWFFVQSASISTQDTAELLLACEDCNQWTRNKLLERVNHGESLSHYRGSVSALTLPSDTYWSAKTFDDDVGRIMREHGFPPNQTASVRRTLIYLALCEQDLSVLEHRFLHGHERAVLEAITLLAPAQVIGIDGPILNALEQLTSGQLDAMNATRLRKAACYVDAALFAPRDMLQA